MNKVIYQPKIQILHIEDDPNLYEPFYEHLIKKGIYVYHVDNLEDAINVIKKCKIDLLVSDGMFPSKKGMKEEKNFIPFVSELIRLKMIIPTIAWSNSTHVHEYCKSNRIESFSKMEVTRRMFEEKNRKYLKIDIKTPFEMADIAEKKLIDMSGWNDVVSKCVFEEYYKEPATIFGAFLALDMRTHMFKETAGLNYGTIVSEIDNGMFRMLIDPINDKKIATSIFNKIVRKNFFPKIKREIDMRADRLISFSRSLKKLDYSKYSNERLEKLYSRFCELFMQMRVYSSLPTAMEHETNMWTVHLQEVLKKKIKNNEEFNKAFSTLTTPEKPSYINQYEVAIAKLGLEKYSGKSIEDKVKKLAEKFAFIAYTFEGIPITIIDVNEKIKILGNSKEEFLFFLKDNKNRSKKINITKKQLIKKYKLTKREAKMCDIGAEIVFIKFFRKGIFAESYYNMEFLISEIGRRIGCTKKQVLNMFAYEVLAALKIGIFPSKMIDARIKESVIFTSERQSMCFSSRVKENYKIKIENISGNESLKGQIAFSGKVSGRVSIINVPEDMKKMKDGDVLVSRSTNPSLIPAMRQSCAFVTDTGGLTCHAAIVAREMKKPCIVGTKIATKVLKDGDLVEVDAEKGVINLL